MLIALILAASPVEVVPVPPRVRSSFTLSPKDVDEKGLPIVAPAVSAMSNERESWAEAVQSWVVSRGGERLGWFAAPARTSRLVVP